MIIPLIPVRIVKPTLSSLIVIPMIVMGNHLIIALSGHDTDAYL
jgi:hypothetical protein